MKLFVTMFYITIRWYWIFMNFKVLYKIFHCYHLLYEGDTLVVTKLDRFARSVSQASELITTLIDRGIKVDVANLGILDNSSISTLMRNILLSFAQFERDMIVERTQEGKAIARLKPDYKEGRPKIYSKKQVEHALKLLETMSYKQVEEVTGISKSTLIRAKRKMNESKVYIDE